MNTHTIVASNGSDPRINLVCVVLKEGAVFCENKIFLCVLFNETSSLENVWNA